MKSINNSQVWNRLFLLLFLFFTSFGNSCSSLKDLASAQKPTLSLDNVRVTDLSLNDIELTFDLGVDNPNPVGVTLASYTYDFRINNTSFVQGEQESGTNISASDRSQLSVPVSFGFNELFDTFSSLKDQDSTAYTFATILNVEIPVLGVVEVPVEKSGFFPVVKVPKFEFKGVQLDNLSFTKADLIAKIGVDNPNAFGINLKGMKYTIDLNGLSPVSGTVDQSFAISEKSQSELIIPLSFNLSDLGMGAFRAIQQRKPLDFTLSGQANLSTTLPLFKETVYDFSEKGTVDIFN
ncbi:MAG: LEA type 2 family protein, partial [Bacteroidota bacterium]